MLVIKADIPPVLIHSGRMRVTLNQQRNVGGFSVSRRMGLPLYNGMRCLRSRGAVVPLVGAKLLREFEGVGLQTMTTPRGAFVAFCAPYAMSR